MAIPYASKKISVWISPNYTRVRRELARSLHMHGVLMEEMRRLQKENDDLRVKCRKLLIGIR